MHLNDDDYDDDHLTEFINYFNFIHTQLEKIGREKKIVYGKILSCGFVKMLRVINVQEKVKN